ncbi:MAG: hypothetical protein JWP87_2396 [Labilithrix sp.]|nr:hypothetical protein [Labilithrix sp.]
MDATDHVFTPPVRGHPDNCPGHRVTRATPRNRSTRSWHARRYRPLAMSTAPPAVLVAVPGSGSASVPVPVPARVPAPGHVPVARPILARPPPAVKRTSIADRVARTFPPLACVRGFRYFTRRAVTLANVSESGVDAEVRGKRIQHVRLRVADGRLAAGCTCAAKLLGPATCKHVWAALLEVDREVALPGLRSTQRALVLGVLDAPPKRPRQTTPKVAAPPPAPPTTKARPMKPRAAKAKAHAPRATARTTAQPARARAKK